MCILYKIWYHIWNPNVAKPPKTKFEVILSTNKEDIQKNVVFINVVSQLLSLKQWLISLRIEYIEITITLEPLNQF